MMEMYEVACLNRSFSNQKVLPSFHYLTSDPKLVGPHEPTSAKLLSEVKDAYENRTDSPQEMTQNRNHLHHYDWKHDRIRIHSEGPSVIS